MEDHNKARLHQKRCKQLFHTGSDFPVFRKLPYFHISAKARIPQVLSLVGIIKSCFHGPASKAGSHQGGELQSRYNPIQCEQQQKSTIKKSSAFVGKAIS